MALLIILCFALALGLSLMLVPGVRSLALRAGFVDCPDSDRKLHRRPIALGGGLAVFLAVVLSVIGMSQLGQRLGLLQLGPVDSRWFVLLLAASAIMLVGLIDDAWSLRGRQKLLLQILIIASLVGSGTIIGKVSFFGFEIHLGAFAFPVTVLWLLLAVNALNLIDGADGMATTVGCFVSAGLAFLAWHKDSYLSAIVAVALSGALAGFLFFNRPPASIFLGDGGSMTIGLIVGVLATWSLVKESTILASAPVAILAIPLFDSSAAILRRWLTGRSIYATDRAHLHHLLQEKFGPQGMLLVVAALCAFTTVLSVLSVYYKVPWLAALGVAVAMGILVMTRTFGHAEARLVLGKTANLIQSFLVTSPGSLLEKQHQWLALQGSGRWETIWEPLVEFAKTHDLAKVKIDLSLAWLHEGYHATWNSVRMPERAFQMTVRLPLFTHRTRDGNPMCIGRLEIVAAANDPTVYDRISDLSTKLVDLGPQVDLIIADLEERHGVHLTPSEEDEISRSVPDYETIPDETVGVTNG